MSFACSLNLNRPDCSDLPWHVGFGETEMPSCVLSESQPASFVLPQIPEVLRRGVGPGGVVQRLLPQRSAAADWALGAA